MNTTQTDNKEKEWVDIKIADEFLTKVKAHKITRKRLKDVLFGNYAIRVIHSVRKFGQESFDVIIKHHELWYMTKEALRKLTP
jgi:hypothetical protein